MRVKLILYIILSMAFLVTGCYYDKEDLLYPAPNANCDTIAIISYAQHVSPLLIQKCSGCHSQGNASGGIAMGTHSLDNVIALNGKLLGTIEHKPGYNPMPQGLARLNTCEIAIIKKWIDNGAVNN
jgi:hypothetical protein